MAVEKVRRGKPKYGIPEKLQALIALARRVRALIGIGAVGQRPAQQPLVFKAISDFFFQLFHTVSAYLHVFNVIPDFLANIHLYAGNSLPHRGKDAAGIR